MIAIPIVLGLLAACVQAGALQGIPAEPLAAPMAVVAVLVAWAAVRDPDETWPALILPAAVLGSLSEERVAWFLLALLPAPALVALLRARERTEPGWRRRVTTAAGAGVLGALAYATILAVAGGAASELAHDADGVIAGGIVTGLIAGCAAAALWPLRPRRRSLFA